MSSITIYGVSASTYVRKVRFALAEKDLEHEHVPIVPMLDPPPRVPGITKELQRHTPLGKIPFARIDDFWLADSSVIFAYIEKLHPTPALLPADPWPHARALWFDEYIDGGAVPKLVTTVYFERVVAPRFFKRPTNEEQVNKAVAEELPKIYGYLDSEIGDRPFLVGDALTIADLAVASFIVNMQQADENPNAAKYPNLARYVGEIHARPKVAALIAEEMAAMAS